MRRIVVFNRVSADGYFAKPDGDLSWFVPDEAIDRAGADQMPHFDAMLFGRRTYEMFEHFWPTVQGAQPAPDPHDPNRKTETIAAMAAWINRTQKLLISKTRAQLSWQNSHLLGEFRAEKLQELKAQPGKDIIVFGSGSIVSQLSAHGLVDEYQFIVSPLLLGSGKAVVSGVEGTRPLELLEAKAYDSGNVVLRYAPKT